MSLAKRATHRDLLDFRLTLEPADYVPPSVMVPTLLVTYYVIPCPAPRITRRDTWKPSPRVVRYHAFKDDIGKVVNQHLDEKRYKLSDLFASVGLRFYVEVAPSWSQKKQRAMAGQPLLLKPDFDNFAKAFYDALFEQDSRAWDVRIQKRYADAGGPRIEVWRLPPWS